MNAQPTSLIDFDLNKLRLGQDFGEAAPVQRVLTNVPVRKPPKDAFFRVRPGGEWCERLMLLDLRQEGESYILSQKIWHVLPDLERPVTIYLAVDRRGNPFLIPVPLPEPDGKWNLWHRSLSEAVKLATEKWVRCSANRVAGYYDVCVANASLSEPEWPDAPLSELLGIAFHGRVIESPDHPVIQQLLGLS